VFILLIQLFKFSGEEEDSSSKKKGKKDESTAVKRDMKDPNNWMPCPRPNLTTEDIKLRLKAIIDKCEKDDLAYAAQIKATEIPDDIRMLLLFVCFYVLFCQFLFWVSMILLLKVGFSRLHRDCSFGRRWMELPKGGATESAIRCLEKEIRRDH
jgi:hypothetical protein